jgi:hypothetical protein
MMKNPSRISCLATLMVLLLSGALLWSLTSSLSIWMLKELLSIHAVLIASSAVVANDVVPIQIQELKKKSSKESASSHIIAFHHCRSTGIEQDPFLR